MTFTAFRSSIAAAVFLLCLLAAVPGRAQLSCNSPAESFSTGIPAGWSVVDNAGQGVVWGDLAACGEAGNYTGTAASAAGAACVSSDHAGQHEFDTELRSPVFSLASATSASLDFNASYQNFAGSDRLDIDISTNGGTTWQTLVRWSEDHGAFRATPGEAARIDLSPFLGMSNLRLRWRYYDPNTNDWDWYAQLDDVKLTCPVCAGTQRPDPTADGGFEAGSPSAAWTETSDNFGTPLCSPATCGFAGARTGDWWAFFGGVAGAAETASLEQTVVIGTGNANLTFYLWNPESSGNGTDALRVKVDGTQVLSIPAGNAIYAAGYTRVVVDLSAYADGNSHTIRFESSTTGSPGNSNFFVDDVSISICQPPPAVLTVADASVTEGTGGTTNLNFTVTLTPASSATVSVDYATADGTAVAGLDYTTTSNTLTFTPGQTTRTVSVPINPDMIDEVDETLTLNLANAVNASIGDGQATGTIVDDDTSNVTINDVAVNEGLSGPTTATFTVSLSKPNSRTVTVDWATAAGTATAGTDYVTASGTVTFAPGQTSRPVAVTVNGDNLNEGNETFFVNLSNAANATITDSQGVGTINEDDPVSITINDVTVAEGNSGTKLFTFTVSLSNPSVNATSVTWQTANGTATAGSDYVAVAPTVLSIPAGQTTGTLSVTVNGDTLNEGNETFFVNLTSPVNATIADNQGVGTIGEDDPVSITINDVSSTEGLSGTKLFTFTVSLSNPSVNATSVTWQTANGTATAGSDYVAVAPTVLSIPANQTTGTVSVTVNGDNLNEGNETFFVNLTSPVNATIADNQGVGTITEDDPVSITINDVSLTEGNSGTKLFAFTVMLSNPSTSAISVTYNTSNGTATAGSDYVAISSTVLSIPANQTTGTINVTVNGDTTGEPNETFNVNLSAPVGATIADNLGVGTILNDDTPMIQVPATLTVDEGSATDPTLTVTLSTPPSSTVTVSYATADGLALSTTDYVALSGTMTFAPGVTSQTITLPLRRDTLPELSEAFFVNFTNPVGAVFSPGGTPPPSQAQTKVTITDDDAVTWNLYGDANNTSIPGCITLSQVGNGRGAAYNFKTFNLSSKFDMLFRVGFGIYDVDGGGGMVFTLRKEGSLILGGADMGYQSITPSVGVEMDTDPQWIADPEYDHIAVDENGATSSHAAGPVQASATSTNIEDGLEHTFRVTRDPVYNQINAYFDGSLRLSYYRDIANTLYGGTQATYFGMTGASNCNSSTCPNNVNYFCPVAICIGDTATPQLQVEDLQVSEGNTGNQTATFKVSLYCPRNELITVNYATANGTATAGLDYLAASGSLVFNPGETQKTVSVTVYPDTTAEADETFFLNLSSPSVNVAVARQGTATIIDDVRLGYGQAGDVPLWGDWDGNGTATPGVWRNGTFYLRNSLSSGPADITVNLGGVGDQPVVGDWTGNHVTKVGIFNGAIFYLKTANTTAASTINVSFGQAGDRPLAGDWNGDGIDTVGVQRGGAFYLRNANFGGPADIAFSYGLAGDVGIAGDWNGDGTDTVGVFRNGTFFLRNSNTTGVADVTLVYGAFGDIPLAGDMDGDHKDNVGFFRSSNATFYLRK